MSVDKVSRYAYPPKENLPPVEQRFEIAKSVGEECQVIEELKKIIEKNPSPVAYDGFEPSGRMHIAQGVLKKINVDKLTSAGFTYIFWVADWFAYLNHKMGGDLEKIKTVGRYFIEVWKALGMNMDRVKFLWASDEIKARGDEYWGLVLEISTKFSLQRVKRCCTIMGRADTGLSSSQILYPCMQTADIFFMEVDVCQLGVDQRKVNMLAREYAQKQKNAKRPVILSHHMLLGLKAGQEKMSKSDPDSAIFMEDTLEDIQSKIKKAFCPPAIVFETEKVVVNPCMDYFRKVIKVVGSVDIKLDDGVKTFKTYEELEADVVAGTIKEAQIKEALAHHLNEIVKPTREQLALLKEKLQRPATITVLFNDVMSMKKGAEKPGKSDPEGTIFIEDTEEEIKTKVTKAYWPTKVSFEKKKTVNPCMDYFKHLIFESFPQVDINRTPENGGNLSFTKYADLEAVYMKDEINPADLKSNLVRYLDLLVKPVRDHFTNNAEAKALLEQVKKFRVTK
eukprot:TRINITY_DN11204_c0_g1_i1.p1 TRINITY_DN11204_c0_g1~~TRINITY_DN11204_c0_g1_i1.p1  ORF type:complete len:508 (-),score=145.86 TRINITY_DN11204_c0_g1_i1:1204-2727(-)